MVTWSTCYVVGGEKMPLILNLIVVEEASADENGLVSVTVVEDPEQRIV